MKLKAALLRCTFLAALAPLPTQTISDFRLACESIARTISPASFLVHLNSRRISPTGPTRAVKLQRAACARLKLSDTIRSAARVVGPRLPHFGLPSQLYPHLFGDPYVYRKPKVLAFPACLDSCTSHYANNYGAPDKTITQHIMACLTQGSVPS
ncbi:hypothetical protein DFH94DRAFT_755106, partial [Russula ochroleuca]